MLREERNVVALWRKILMLAILENSCSLEGRKSIDLDQRIPFCLWIQDIDDEYYISVCNDITFSKPIELVLTQ